MKTAKLFSIPCFFIKKGKKMQEALSGAGVWKGAWNRSGSLNIRKSSEWQGIWYEEYHLSIREWLLYAAQGAVGAALLVFVFYRSVPVFFIFLPLGLCYPLYIRRDLKKKRLEALRLQFKDAILVVASCLNAGYSVENAFAASLEEVNRLYGSDSMISAELRLLIHKIKLNRPLEEALEDLAQRSGIEDIDNFAEVFLAARKSGGELMKIIARTAEIIGEKIRIQEDILTMTASKRLEQKIMSAIPILIVFYIEFTSPSFFDILYTTLMGRVIMTFCLFVYLLACQTARMFLDIEI